MVTLWVFPGGSQVGKHYSAEQWAAWVGEQLESELSVAEFCDWIGVSLNSFYRWRQKLAAKGRPPARKGHEAQRLSGMKGAVSSGPELVPLTVLTSPVVEIDLPCGAVVRVPNEDRSLRRVLGILLEAGQSADVSPIATPCLEHHRGGRR
jgi:transposase-like protein